MDIDGTTALIGAFHETIGQAFEGVSYFFTLSSSRPDRLVHGGAGRSDRCAVLEGVRVGRFFGRAVAIDGDTVVAGQLSDAAV